MHKLSGGTIEKIASLVLSVIVVSVFSSFVQTSRAEQMSVTGVQQIDQQIAEQLQKVKELQLKKFASQTKPFSDEDLVRLLIAVGFEGKNLNKAYAVAKKETHGNPKSYNNNRTTGDNSYGLFQINMIGQLGVDRREKYNLITNEELFNPVVNAKIAYQMSSQGDDWTSWHIGVGNHEQDAVFQYWYDQMPKGVTL
jgi:Tfp pilus assembly protein PilE